MSKKKRWLIIVAIILFIFSIGYMIVGVFVPDLFDKEYNETNTVEFTATVKSIEENQQGYKIYMNEYPAYLHIETYQLVSDSLLTINKGDVISFRVITKEQVESPIVDEIYVVSLKSLNTEFITLNSSTKLLQNDIKNGRIISITVSIVMLVCAVCMISFVLYKRKKINA